MSEASHLKTLVKSMQAAPIMVIGDIMLDKFVYGHVDRISPESPVPVLSIKREDKMLGGAGNAIANLAGLKAKPFIISVVGDDDSAESIRDQLRALEVDDHNLVIENNRPTTVKTRFLAGHQQLLRSDYEHKKHISEATRKEVLDKAKSTIPNVKALIISDYGKGLLSTELIKDLIQIADQADIPVIVDPKGQDFSIYSGATCITPNKKELSEATKGRPVEQDLDIIKAAEDVMQTCNIKSVIATRSKDGISVIQNGQEPFHVRSADIEVYDVSGAGDTVIATVASALAAGGTLNQAAQLANIAGSIVVTKVGTAPIRANELSDAAGNDTHNVKTTNRQADYLQWDEAAEQVKRWKAQGLKVGFTNGCFDILHSGHVRYLDQARGLCDRLVMGLNSDSS
ncbi:MAG: D-glycero-beta-D-manno-heptose-7-phosphate kinase, partial [Bdellovibrionales bacterium]